ncbi:molecular chaperone HtpG [Verrucomicrobiota bacterium]
MSAQKHEFKTELNKLLDIIIHSLYSHKEIFLRELISNAGDAIDKARFEALNDDSILEGNSDWAIELIPDEEAKTLTIRDNGIGMSYEDLMENLGTIAHSGTATFLAKLQEADLKEHPELIGQFGVGFYSSFMVADEVTVLSRRAGGAGSKWNSKGDGTFTIEECDKETRGTDIILHLKEEEGEFLQEWQLKSLVKKFSDFLEHPINLGEETVNTRKALWLRSKSDVTEEEYNEFYKSLSHDFEDPAETIHFVAEGAQEFKSVLFIPNKRPMDMFQGEPKSQLHLYIQRVFISNDCDELLPGYMRFIRGVVDAADLPLNVSREMLQHNPKLGQISSALVKRVLKTLKEMKRKDAEKYEAFFKEFGPVLKEGLVRDFANQEKLLELMLIESTSTESGKFTTLDDYISAMPSDQHEIYYLSGQSRELLENSPHLEASKSKNREVLFFTDAIDEFVVPGLSYKDKKFVAINKDEIEETEEEKAKSEEAAKTFKGLLDLMGEKLADLKEVRLSKRLTESAACLVQDANGLNPQMEAMLRSMGQDVPESKAILEINPEHPAVKAIQALAETDKESAADYGQLLYDQALVAEGREIKDPAAFAKRINSLLTKIG